MSPIPPTQLDDESPHFDFGEVAHDVYPHAAGRRLARILDVAPRLAQRWVVGEIPPTEKAIEHVQAQEKALQGLGIIGSLEALIEKWSAAGVDNESIAAHLALMHEKLVDRPLE